MLGFLWMKWKICCSSRLPIGRRVAFFCRNNGMSAGRPLTPLHGGHVGLLCTAGMLNGVFGEGEDRHIAHWRSVKFTDHWEEEEADGTRILHDRERFSHELTLVLPMARPRPLPMKIRNPNEECSPSLRLAHVCEEYGEDNHQHQ